MTQGYNQPQGYNQQPDDIFGQPTPSMLSPDDLANVPPMLKRLYQEAAARYQEAKSRSVGNEREPEAQAALNSAWREYNEMLDKIAPYLKPATEPAPKSGTIVKHNDGSQWMHDPVTGEPIKQMTDPGYGVQAPQQPRQYAPWEEEEARTRTAKMQQEMENPSALRRRWAEEQIERIKASGKSLADMDKEMQLVWDQFFAGEEGTTLAKKREFKQTLAQRQVADRAQTQTNLAQGLFSGLGGIYGKIYGNTKPPFLDPFAMAQSYTDQAYGGDELNELARAVLRGAFGGQ